jgi:glyoxylase-like metal-dependent hydrolase (beta-lactamase superfamily II)
VLRNQEILGGSASDRATQGPKDSPMMTEQPAERPGAPTETIDGPLLIRHRSVSEMDNNVYVLACTRTRQALIVDAADDAPAIRDLVEDLDPLAVVQTHGHWDHVRAWADLVADPGLEVWGHEGDLELYPLAPDRLLVDGQLLQVGDVTVEVVHLPGHTEGSLLLLAHGATQDWLVSGDTLFPGGPGNTRGDAVRHTRIMDGLEQRVFARLMDGTVVLPGHGKPTTIGEERPSLAEWRARGW